MSSHVKDLFIPAAGVRWLTGIYDPALALLMRERVWRPRLLTQVAPQPGERILDFGCGTGTLTVMLQQARPQAEIVGLDIDRDVLRIARAKAAAASVSISFLQGRAGDPSIVAMLGPGSFDKIVSSLVFHHLSTDEKRLALATAYDLLRSGGEMHVADWGRPANALMRLLFHTVQVLDGYSNTSDNVQGRLPDRLREAGLSDVAETHRASTVFGTLCFYRGVKR